MATAAAPFVVVLPNGYEIMKKPTEPMLVKRSNGAVVVGPVERYIVMRDVVAGVVPSPSADANNKSARSKAQPGHFILQTSTGDLKAGLAEDAWKQQLGQLGLDTSPYLEPPVLPK